MSELTELRKAYGVRLDMTQLAEFMGIERSSLISKISRGDCPIPTYKEGKFRYCNVTSLASYLAERGAIPV